MNRDTALPERKSGYPLFRCSQVQGYHRPHRPRRRKYAGSDRKSGSTSSIDAAHLASGNVHRPGFLRDQQQRSCCSVTLFVESAASSRTSPSWRVGGKEYANRSVRPESFAPGADGRTGSFLLILTWNYNTGLC
jgi:hypothetical protein